VGGFTGWGIGGGGCIVAGYEGGGEEGRDGENRKFCATFRVPASGFSYTEPGRFAFILLRPAAAKVHGINDRIIRTVKIKFFFIFITPSIFSIRQQAN
jgi:hypothetical protein